MENFVFPDNFQGMLIFVKWHESKKGKRYIIPILYGNKIIIGLEKESPRCVAAFGKLFKRSFSQTYYF